MSVSLSPSWLSLTRTEALVCERVGMSRQMGWDSERTVELSLALDVVSSIQLDYCFLGPQTCCCTLPSFPPELLVQLLAVIHWLAQQSNQIAD